MNIEIVSIKSITAYKGNPREITAEAVKAVQKSIKSYGFNTPIVVDAKGEIVAGHTRLSAARRLRMKNVPIVRAEGLSQDQINQFRIVDNRCAEMSRWDEGALKAELRSVGELGALEDLFPKEEIDALMAIGKIDAREQNRVQRRVDAKAEERQTHAAKSSQAHQDDKVSFACPCCSKKVTVSHAAIKRSY